MEEQVFSGLHAELTGKVLKVFYKVAGELGFGFLESVYRKSMLIALRQAGMTVEEEVPIPVLFRGQSVGVFYADLVVDGLIILELKTAETLSKSFELQLLHYLRSTRMEVGLLLAFGERAQFRRVILTNNRKASLV